jgi:hypothetical protein
MRFSAGKRPWSFGRGLWLLLACIVHLPGGAAALDDIGSRISGLLAERGMVGRCGRFTGLTMPTR